MKNYQEKNTSCQHFFHIWKKCWLIRLYSLSFGVYSVTRGQINFAILADLEKQEMNDFKSGGNKLSVVLTKLMELNHVTLTQLHKNTNIPLPTLKRLQSEPDSNPTISTILPLADFFNISIHQLVGLEPLPDKNLGFVENRQHWSEIPLISWQQLAEWLKHPDSFEKFEEYVLTDLENDNSLYAVKVNTDDWVGFMKGSVLIIDPTLKPEHKDYAIVCKKGIMPTLKQIFLDEDKVYLKPLSLDVKPTLMDDSYECLGIVIQIKTDIKER